MSATNASFAAGQFILIHQTRGTGAGNWELNKIQSYTSGTITTTFALTNDYTSGAQVLVMKQYSSVLIDTGVTLTGKAWNGTVGGIIGWFCNDLTNIPGIITLTGLGFAGGTSSSSGQGVQGYGHAGAGAYSKTANHNGGGGGADGGGDFAY